MVAVMSATLHVIGLFTFGLCAAGNETCPFDDDAVSIADSHAQSLVQTSVRVSTLQREQARKAGWFHIPKCGTTFGLTLQHYLDPSWPDTPGTYWEVPEENAGQVWPEGLWGSHTAIDQESYDTWHGHFAGMFRTPSARMYSSWAHFASPATSSLTGDEMEPEAYADRVRGLVTKMLSGQQDGSPCSQIHFPDNALGGCDNRSTPDLELALSRLPGFKFVGLTDEWYLSVCLFHVMFGGECLPSEFVDSRPGNYSDTDEAYAHAEEVFRRYHDPFDDAVFAQVSSIFWSNVAKFNVDESSCRSICPRASDASAANSTVLPSVAQGGD